MIGQDGKIIFVRHRSIYVRVSANRIVKLNDEVKIPEKTSRRRKINSQLALSLQLSQKNIKKIN